MAQVAAFVPAPFDRMDYNTFADIAWRASAQIWQLQGDNDSNSSFDEIAVDGPEFDSETMATMVGQLNWRCEMADALFATIGKGKYDVDPRTPPPPKLHEFFLRILHGGWTAAFVHNPPLPANHTEVTIYEPDTSDIDGRSTRILQLVQDVKDLLAARGVDTSEVPIYVCELRAPNLETTTAVSCLQWAEAVYHAEEWGLDPDPVAARESLRDALPVVMPLTVPGHDGTVWRRVGFEPRPFELHLQRYTIWNPSAAWHGPWSRMKNGEEGFATWVDVLTTRADWAKYNWHTMAEGARDAELDLDLRSELGHGDCIWTLWGVEANQRPAIGEPPARGVLCRHLAWMSRYAD